MTKRNDDEAPTQRIKKKHTHPLVVVRHPVTWLSPTGADDWDDDTEEVATHDIILDEPAVKIAFDIQEELDRQDVVDDRADLLASAVRTLARAEARETALDEVRRFLTEQQYVPANRQLPAPTTTDQPTTPAAPPAGEPGALHVDYESHCYQDQERTRTHRRFRVKVPFFGALADIARKLLTDGW